MLKKKKFKKSLIAVQGILSLKKMFSCLAECRTMFPFAVSCKIGALERNAYWFHVKLIFVIFGQQFILDVRD